MHDFIKRNKREIIVGVGVSIITTFIMGIGNWFFANAPKIGTSILDTLLNIAYTLAATRTDNQIIVMILSGLLLFVFVSLLPPFTRVMSPFISAIKKQHKSKVLTDNEVKRINNSSDNCDKEPTTAQEAVSDSLKKPKQSVLQAMAVVLLLILFDIFVVLFLMMPTILHNNFERDVIIIHPYVEEQQILRLKSDWALMRSKSDYATIYEYIDSIKEENDLLR